MAERMPNEAMLIDSLVLQEARASSEIEKVLTTNDELFKAASDEAMPASAEAKEVLRYRQALNHGFRQIKDQPLATGVFIEIAQLIKRTDFSVRRTPGTRIANSRGETLYMRPEGELIIRDKLRDLENFMHADNGLNVLVKTAHTTSVVLIIPVLQTIEWVRGTLSRKFSKGVRDGKQGSVPMFAGVEQSMDGKQSRVGRGQEASRRVGRACAGDTVSVPAMLGGVVGL